MKQAAFVGIAGMFGAILRTTIGFWIGKGHSFPVATFLVNMVATWLLCFIATGILNNVMKKKQTQEIVTIGFLGSFSTFSAFSIETVLLFESGQLFMAFVYVSANIVGGIGIGLFGFQCGRKWQLT